MGRNKPAGRVNTEIRNHPVGAAFQRKTMQRVLPVLALTLLCACGATTPPTPAAQATASPVALSCTTSGDASASWPAPSAASSSPAILSATLSGDTMKLTFASGTPAFQVQPASSAHFTIDPSGQPVSLAGSAGVRIAMQGFRGDTVNYAGPKTLSSSGPLLMQVASIGDFEGYVSWGVGLSGPGCANVTASGSTLTFTFIAAP
jgi:hypothetical protein